MYLCLDYIVCHNSRLQATIYHRHVGVVRRELRNLHTGSVVECYF